MLHQTRGIVLHQTKYSETSLIVKIYTELFGLQTYMIRGVRKSGSKIKAGILQNLNLVDLIVYKKEKSDIQNIKEIRMFHQYKQIPFDVVKSSVLIFLNEILYKSIREEGADQDLFEFIFDSLEILDDIPDPVNFHVLFLIRLSKYLGFYPRQNYTGKQKYFNLLEGEFEEKPILEKHSLTPELSSLLYKLTHTQFKDLKKVSLSGSERHQLVTGLLDYYAFHLPGFGNIKSHQVLREVLE